MKDFELEKIPVDIPIEYLLELATNGEEGSGKLQSYIVGWAHRVCLENYLEDKMRVMQFKKFDILRQNLKNLIGDSNMKWVDGVPVIQNKIFKKK